MSHWREVHKPQRHWAPSGLPRALLPLPGWIARIASEARFAGEACEFGAGLARHPDCVVGGIPSGEGRPVLVVPGFGFGDASTMPLQIALQQAGYTVVRSRILANVGCADRTVDALAEVARVHVDADRGRRLLVVGHSRGGMIARGLAVRHPELVQRVISLAAPLNHEFAFYEIPQPYVSVLRRMHWRDPVLRQRQCSTAACTCPYMLATERPMPPGLELVSIYTKSDGIVDWRACVVAGARNIEVPGSHLGMGLKPETLRLVLSELCAPWRSDSELPEGDRSVEP